MVVPLKEGLGRFKRHPVHKVLEELQDKHIELGVKNFL